VSAAAHGAELGRLLRLLAAAEVVEAEAALAGRLSVTEHSRSHAVGLVAIDGRPVAVVKGGEAAEEAIVYRWLAASPAADVAPELIADVADALVTRPWPSAVSLHEALADAAEPDALVAELGRLLGLLHAAGAPALPARRPWILGVPDGRPPAMYADNAEALGLLAEIGRRPAIVAAIARLGRGWTARAAIHGDVKFDNVLVGPAGMRIVDWELAGRGEPVWDLAGVVDGLLLPRCLGGQGPLDRALIAHLAAPALDAHRAAAGAALSPGPERLATAVVARLAQTATQLAAMGDAHAEAAPIVLEAAAELAEPAVAGWPAA
jgi:aminoglycoside phosphotransferase (APT) family kinase protein